MHLPSLLTELLVRSPGYQITSKVVMEILILALPQAFKVEDKLGVSTQRGAAWERRLRGTGLSLVASTPPSNLFF